MLRIIASLVEASLNGNTRVHEVLNTNPINCIMGYMYTNIFRKVKTMELESGPVIGRNKSMPGLKRVQVQFLGNPSIRDSSEFDHNCVLNILYVIKSLLEDIYFVNPSMLTCNQFLSNLVYYSDL